MAGTILFVEDNPDDELLLKLALRREKILNPIQVVRNGEEAICYLQAEGPYTDRKVYPVPILVLLDLIMPRKSGFEVIEWMQEHPRFRRLPVIVLSGATELIEANRACQPAARTYIQKPVAVQELARALSAVKGLRLVSGTEGGQYIEDERRSSTRDVRQNRPGPPPLDPRSPAAQPLRA